MSTGKVKTSASMPVRLSEDEIPARHEGFYAKARREFFRNWGAVIGLIWIILMILSAVFAHVLTPYDPLQRDAEVRLTGPSLEHPMGADALGRDIFSRVLYGGRISLQVGFFSIIGATVVGVPLGLVAGYFGGRVDSIIMRAMDIILAFPGLILIIWIVGLLGSSLTNVIFSIAFFSLPTYARLVRSIALTTREMDYVMAARSVGAGSPTILAWHVFPSVIGPLIVLTTLSVSGAIVTGASLSFLGLGVPPPAPEWGSMLADGRSYLRNAWWMAVFPGFTITLLVLAANIVGDGLRDALDPRTQK